MEVTNSDWAGEIKSKGSKVWIRVRPTINVGDYTVDGDISYQDLQDDKIELDIDKAKYFAFKVDDVDAAQADIKIMNEASIDAAKQMTIKIENVVFGSVYSSAGTAMTSQQITKINVLDWLVDINTSLDENNVPQDGRFVVIPPWVGGMIQKSDLKDASISGDSKSLMRGTGNGALGTVGNLRIYISNNLTGSATSGTPTHALAGHRDGVCYASQFVKTETLRLQNQFGDAIRGLNVFGFKVTKPEALRDCPVYK